MVRGDCPTMKRRAKSAYFHAATQSIQEIVGNKATKRSMQNGIERERERIERI